MDKDELIQRLRAALSWELAPRASNPAYQAYLELQRDKQEGLYINFLGIPSFPHKYSKLFEVKYPLDADDEDIVPYEEQEDAAAKAFAANAVEDDEINKYDENVHVPGAFD